MTPRIPLVLCLATALSTSACGTSPMSTPEYKRNPAPRERYEITVTVADAPGVFEAVAGNLHYEVLDDFCIPKDFPSGARTRRPIEHIPIAWRRVSDAVYVATVHTDLLVDEDYFGLGTCRWSFVSASIELTHGKTSYVSHLMHDELVAQEPHVTYYWKGHYDQNEIEDFADYGEADPARYKPEFRNSLFTISLEARNASR